MKGIIKAFWPAASSAMATYIVIHFSLMQSNLDFTQNRPGASPEASGATATAIPAAASTPSLPANALHAVVNSDPASSHISQLTKSQRPDQRAILEMTRQATIEHQTLLAAHDRELRNPVWALKIENKVEELFKSPPTDSKIHMEAVDCRADTCAITISWKSREDAISEARLASQMVAVLPCSDRMVFPEVSSSPYQAVMLLDCSGHQVDATLN